VLNPTAVFCNDRDKYYTMLALADAGTSEGQEAWCVYVLTGILDELKKVDQLADFSYLRNKILTPALAYAKERQLITSQEEGILNIAAKMGTAKLADFAVVMPNLTPANRGYQIKRLVERKMLQPVSEGARQYTFGFSNNYLLRGVIKALSSEGFIPATLHAEQN
jgi:Fic family protein